MATPVRWINTLIFLTLFLLSVPWASATASFDPQIAPFAVQVNGRLIAHATDFRAVLPGEELILRIPGRAVAPLSLQSDRKVLTAGKGTLRWRVPKEVGYVPLTITSGSEKGAITLQLFIMRPATEVVNGRLSDYRIGNYPPPLRDLDAYAAPRGFIEVTPELEHLAVSPHFKLGQFLSKQQSGYPKYLVLRPKLLTKLEFLLAEINSKGIRADSFVIMSGYRTPFYNRAINNVANSRHVYGGAADIFVDVQPQDGVMDDLNGDGKVDVGDAALLYDIADTYVKRTGNTELTGGVGLYKSTAAHGPFVHIDVRGTRARW